MNHFEFFKIPIQFYPDLKMIAKKFKMNTLANHPDLNAGGVDSEILTAQNNAAYAQLKNERKRIAYILSLGIVHLEKKSLSPEFLMEMMEVNEALMYAQLEGEDTQEQLNKVEIKDKKIWSDIAKLGARHDAGELDFEEACVQINNLYLQSNYMLRILDNHGS